MTTAMMPGHLAVVDMWTGSDASRLRTALRLTFDQFAELLGVAVCTVTKWATTPALVPTMELQQELDALLLLATPEEQQRFTLSGSDRCAHCGQEVTRL